MKIINKNIVRSAGLLLLGLLLGWLIFGGNENAQKGAEGTSSEHADHQIWTCSMHPQIRQQEPGKCPICGMDLVPLESGGEDVDSNGIQMSEAAMKLSNVQTMMVGTEDVTKELRLNGKVETDERRNYIQTTHVPGRIEKLNVNFTGESIKIGQTLAVVYSPELVTAQEELLQAARIKDVQPEIFEAAKQKLRNWKISERVINNIIEQGKPIGQFPISANVSGFVTDKKVALGDYVMPGAPLYEIADLSSVWVLFDLYESDLSWVHTGDKISYTIQSLPGEKFEGVISFIDPIINPKTRVATARVEVKNSDYRLKPEMFASGIIVNKTAKSGEGEIVVPRSAVMWTGERSVVYIRIKSAGNTSFELREVMLGPSLGDSYVVRSGLDKGDEIVVNGTFTVDAAAQLAGKPSMMNRGVAEVEQEEVMEKHEIAAATITELEKVINDYLKLKDALVNDNFAESTKLAATLKNTVSEVNMEGFKGEAHNSWMMILKDLQESIANMNNSTDITNVRDHFEKLSAAMIDLSKSFGPFTKTMYVQHCPMADDNKGADWLSLSKEVMNPYFGKSMLKCGEVIAEIK